MIQSTGLPLWLRLLINDTIKGYQITMQLCEQRCRDLRRRGKRNQDDKLADDIGVIDEYRMDAKYCAGQIARFRVALEGRLTPNELETGPWQEIPRDPRKMANWAFQPLDDEALPKPDLDVVPPTQPRLHEVMAGFSPRERQVLIYCVGARWSPEDAAKQLDIPVYVVKRLLRNATSKLRHGIEGP